MNNDTSGDTTWAAGSESFLNVTWAPPFSQKTKAYQTMLIALTCVFAILLALVAAAAGFFIYRYRLKIKSLEGGQTERGQDGKSSGRPASGATSVTSSSVPKAGD